MRWLQGLIILLVLFVLGSSGLLLGLMLHNSAQESPNLAQIPTLHDLPSAIPNTTSTQTETAPPIAPSSTHTYQPTNSSSPTITQSLTATPTHISPTPSLIPSATPYAAFASITSKVGAYLRGGPGIAYETLGQVQYEDVFPIVAYAQDRLNWYLIELPDGRTAWISEVVATLITDAPALEVGQVVTIPPTPTLIPSMTLTPADSLERQLQSVPILSDVSDGMREVVLHGLEMGNDAHKLAKVGDCNTVSDSFLKPFDGENYKLGSYDTLAQTIRYFQGSFDRPSVASEIGFNVYSVQDSIWSDPAQCKQGENPLVCEYRLMNPVFAIIMFGANDILQFKPDAFERYLRQIIEETLERGILPILNTFTRRVDERWDRMLELNLVVVHLAEEYDIPLINFWLAAQYLPDHGIYPDNAHLSQGSWIISFEGGQDRWGHALRNLLTLQMLDKLRRELPLPQ